MDLTVKLPTPAGELVLKNPIMPAAGTFGNAVEYGGLVDLAALGAIIPASVCYEKGAPPPAKRCHRTPHGIISSFGPDLIGYKGFLREYLPRLPHDEVPIIVNIKARSMAELEEMLAELGQADGVAGFELNLNCPYGRPAADHYWRDADRLLELLERGRAAAKDKLFWVKAPSSEYLAGQVLPVVEETGCDGFCSFNGITGYAIDITTRKFYCGTAGGGGYSGPGIKPFAMMCAHEAAKNTALPVIGGGGITCADDVLEYIMAGAWAVQVGSANLQRPDFMPRLLEDLQARMEALGIASLREIRGTAQYT